MMENIKLEFSQEIYFGAYTNQIGIKVENSPENRIDIVKWQAMNILFKQFEDVERKRLHNTESDKFLIEIIADIAKAKVEKKNQICLEGIINSSDINFELNGKDGEWRPKAITKANIAELLLTRSSSNYYHGFSPTQTILQERRVGIAYLAILKLLKRRKTVRILIGRKLTGSWTSGWKPTLIVSW